MAGGAQQAPSRASSITSHPGPASPPGGQQLPSRPQKCPGDQNLAVGLAGHTPAAPPSHAAERGPHCHASLGATHHAAMPAARTGQSLRTQKSRHGPTSRAGCGRGPTVDRSCPSPAPGARGPWSSRSPPPALGSPSLALMFPVHLPLLGTASPPSVESHRVEKCLKRKCPRAAPVRLACARVLFLLL